MDHNKVRSRITDKSLVFSLPSPRSVILVIIFLCLLAGFGFGLFINFSLLIDTLFGRSASTASDLSSFLYLLPFFLLQLGVSTFSLYKLLWHTVGVEIIEVDPLAIHIKRKVLFLERSKKYPVDNVYNLRPYRPLRSLTGQVMKALTSPSEKRLYRSEEGYIAFESGDETCYLGSGINLQTAKQIVAQIYRRFPAYAKRNN